MPLHSEVVRYLLNKYPYANQKAGEILEKLSVEIIAELISLYPGDLLPQKRKDLLFLFLIKKLNLLNDIRSEVDNG